MKRKYCALTLILSFIIHVPTFSINYYVRSTGNDANSGLTTGQAWLTISKVNSVDLNAGDSVLFEGNQTFAGNLYLDPTDEGSSLSPVVIASYGGARATINAGSDYGVYAYNAGGIEIIGLTIVGSGMLTNTNSGIIFYNDLPGNIKKDHVYISDVTLHSFGKKGIYIGAFNASSKNTGYSDLKIKNTIIHDIREDGIYIYGNFDIAKTGYAHQTLYIGNCQLYDIPGKPSSGNHSGNGIVISDVTTATIEKCVVHNCGTANDHCGGPVGIWAWDADNIIIQYNEVYNMQTASTCDGGGFDLDGGVKNSIVQYNYSHDNDGPGYLVAQFQGARTLNNLIFRYNISENDARKNNYGAISLWVSPTDPNGGNNNVYFYNNTIFADKNIVPTGGGVRVMESLNNNIRFWNNIFYTKNGPTEINIDNAGQDIRLENNLYFSTGTGAGYSWTWGGTSVTSLPTFRTMLGLDQERSLGFDVGMVADPLLQAPGSGGIVGDPESMHLILDSYKLTSGSPAIDAGSDISSLYSIASGGQDFYQKGIPILLSYDYGVHELDNTLSVTTPKKYLYGTGNKGLEHFSLYPNPSSGIINIIVSEEVSQIKIMDLFSKEILPLKNVVERAFSLDLSGNVSGNYIIQLYTSEEIVTKIFRIE